MNKKPTTDGFVSRRRTSSPAKARPGLDNSRHAIDKPTPQTAAKLSRRGKRRLKIATLTPKQRIRRRAIFIFVWTLIGILVIAGGYLAYRALSAGSRVLQGNIFDIVQSQPLKEDTRGRSNFLIFGTAEDDEGGKHDGKYLTDSIMIVSISQTKKDAYMVSLPRDLWIDIDMPEGEVCDVGYQQKLNAQFKCASNYGENERKGAESLLQKVTQITGVDIQYFVHVNFSVVSEAVDAVGGIDVTIEGSDPRGILDRNFDWKCNFECYYVNYKIGEKVHLDGIHALALARARNAPDESGRHPGYGLPNGNFDREKNQQMIIKALLNKAVSAGTLTNLGTVSKLLDAFGNNLRTNIETKEVRTLMDLGTGIPNEKIYSISLVEEGEAVVMNDQLGITSIVRPIAGLKDYGGIQAYIKRQIFSEPYMKENPHVVVLNGSETAGVAQTLADTLEEKGFLIDAVDNAPEGTYGKIEVYQINSTKTASAAKLKELYNVTLKTTTPPVNITGETDFVIIIGGAAT